MCIKAPPKQKYVFLFRHHLIEDKQGGIQWILWVFCLKKFPFGYSKIEWSFDCFYNYHFCFCFIFFVGEERDISFDEGPTSPIRNASGSTLPANNNNNTSNNNTLQKGKKGIFKKVNTCSLNSHISYGVRKKSPQKKSPRKKTPQKKSPRTKSPGNLPPMKKSPKKISPRKKTPHQKSPPEKIPLSLKNFVIMLVNVRTSAALCVFFRSFFKFL